MQSYTNLIQALEYSAKTNNGITFINSNSDSKFISYNRLYNDALEVLSGLQAHGVKTRDELIFQIEDNYQFITFFWAAILGGIIPVPITIAINDEFKSKVFHVRDILDNPWLIIQEKGLSGFKEYAGKNDLNHEFISIEQKTIFIDNIKHNAGKAILTRCQPDEIAFIQFSSGSTGDPKGVCLTHENLVANINAILIGLAVDGRDSSLSWLPLTHDMGLIGFHLAPLSAGANQYIMPPSLFIRNPVLWMQKAAEYKVTTLSSPNFGYQHFLNRLSAYETLTLDLSAVRVILNGAEPIAADLCFRFLSIMEKYKLSKQVMFPVYGLAEAALAVTFPPLEEELQVIHLDRNHLALKDQIIESSKPNAVQFVDVGFPVANCQVRIGDEYGNELPENCVGIIYIKGKNVTPGYYNDKTRTDEILDTDGWLNTGDMGFMRNGRLVVTGRVKDILFVNGQNYYPQDIERCAENVEGCGIGKAAACGSFDHGYQRDIILLFIWFSKSISTFLPLTMEIKKAINMHMGLDIQLIIPVKSLPRTTSGKLQRYKLIEQFREGLFDERISELNKAQLQLVGKETSITMLSTVEKELLHLVEQTLAIRNIGLDDSLLAIGMDSIKAINIISALRNSWQKEIPMDVLLKTQTIRQLASIIENMNTTTEQIIPPAPKSSHYPLSSHQNRVYILQQIEAGSTVYNITRIMIIRGTFDYNRFEAVINHLIERHESLRTSFQMTDRKPIQVISPAIDFIIEYHKQQGRSIDEIALHFNRPFDLCRPPLFRVSIVLMENGEHLFLFCIHHIIADGSSAVILCRELEFLLAGKELPVLKSRYKDFAIWHNNLLSTGEYDRQKMYWLDELKAPIPVLNLAYDFPRPVRTDFTGAKLKHFIDSNLAAKLKASALACSVTFHTLLLTAYHLLLFKYSGQQDIITGIPVSGRHYPGMQDVAGMFVNTLLIRSNPRNKKVFDAYLREINEKMNMAFKNQDYPFESIASETHITRDMGRNPLFDTMFVLQNMGDTDIHTDQFEVINYDWDDRISKFDLTLFAEEKNNEIHLTFEYAQSLFDKTTIQRMAESYKVILEIVAQNSTFQLQSLDILSEADRKRLITEFNHTSSPYPYNRTVCGLFEDQAAALPGQTAIEFNGQVITYGQLNRKADQLAFHLQSKGITEGQIVALVEEPCVEAVIAVLAVFKTGCAYLPVDPALPMERIEFILTDSKSVLVLTRKKQALRIPVTTNQVFIDDEIIYKQDKQPVSCKEKTSCLAYIIYTSGSTGTPKGVAVEHRGLVNYIWWAVKMYVKSDSEFFPLFTSLAFDLTVTSIFAPLVSGNAILIYPDDPHEFVLNRIMRENKATVIKLTPSHLSLLKDHDNSLSSVRRFIVGGEDLKTNLARAVLKSFAGNVEIYNEYGPTETVVGCMIHKYDPQYDCRISVPIGVPADNVQIYLLDESLKPVPYGKEGELYISGDGLARGYLNNPGLTAAKFVDHPFIPGKKMYKSGDIARFLRNGIIEYTGREDCQVKIHGYRIEPGEIEKHLLEIEFISSAVVVDMPDEASNSCLVAFLITKQDFDSEEIRARLSRFLPQYMIPLYFIKIESIPLSINGKVNKEALPVVKKLQADNSAFIAPGNEKERIIIDVMRDVLQKEKISMEQNFFQLGGDSIKAIQALTMIRNKGYKIQAKSILTFPRFSDMALHLESGGSSAYIEQSLCEGALARVPVVQWFFTRNFPVHGYYNQSLLLTINQELTNNQTSDILKNIIRHHDALRLNYDTGNNTLFYNNNHLDREIPCVEYDLSAYPYEIQCIKIKHLGGELKSEFDIERDLLIKVSIFNLGQEGRRLLLTAHHLLVDAVSWRIILEDFSTLFMQSKKGQPYCFTQKTNSLQQWAAAFQEYRAFDIRQELDYWQAVNNKKPSLPYGYKGQGEITAGFTIITRHLTEDATHSLLDTANKAFSTRPLELMLSSLAAALECGKENKDMVIELEGHGREEIPGITDISRTTGWFTLLYPVCFQINASDLSSRIKAVKEQLRSIPGNGMGFGILKYREKEINETNFKYIRFNYLGELDLQKNDLFEFAPEESGDDISPYNSFSAVIEINLMVKQQKLHVLFSYHEQAFEKGAAGQFADLYIKKLNEIIEYCCSKTTRELTPSDFDLVKLKENDLDALLI